MDKKPKKLLQRYCSNVLLLWINKITLFVLKTKSQMYLAVLKIIVKGHVLSYFYHIPVSSQYSVYSRNQKIPKNFKEIK